MFKVPTVLFVCNGNIFRSRLAEALFNHHAEVSGLGWCAFSRGLDPGLTDFDGISTHLCDALDAKGIAHHHTSATRTALTEEDLEMAHLIIALSENEHRPVVADRFPDWAEQFNYWDVADHDRCAQEDAAPVIEREVMALVDEITAAGQE